MKKLLLILNLLWCSFSFAQKMNLKQCVEIAAQNNPNFLRAQLNTEMAIANTQEAKSRRIPQIEAFFAQGMNFGRSIDRFSNLYINQLYNSSFGNLQLALPVYNGFQIKNQTESAKLLYEAENYNKEAQKNQLTIQILRAYTEVLAGYELLKAAKNLLENSENQLLRQQQMFQAGTSDKLEKIQFENQIALNKGNVIDAKYNLEIAKLALFQLMNIQPNYSLEFEPIKLKEIKSSLINLSQVNPKDFLPEFKSFDLQTKSISRTIKATKANNLPNLRFFANYSTFYASSNPERAFFQQLNDTRNGGISLNLSIPIFSKFQTSPRLQQLAIQEKITANNQKIRENSLSQEIETTQLMLEAFSNRLDNANLQIALSGETLRLVEARIAAGTINATEFSIASANYQRAVSAQIEAKFRWVLQNKLLEFYTSGDFNFD